MEAANSPTTEQAGSETLFLTRSFDAKRRRVFQAWADAERLSSWWGPRGFTLSSCELDFRPGGAFHIVMRGPDGTEYPFDGVYREIVPNELIVFTGKVGRDDIMTTVTFAEWAGRTTLTVHQAVPSDESYARGQQQGWTETLERLGESLVTH